MIAVVGPLASLAVAAGAFGLWFITPDGLLKLAVEGLFLANLVVGVLNLLPGLPLDGGRVLKAVVWRMTGNMHRATIVAGWGGRIAAILALLWPLFQEVVLDVRSTMLDYVLAVVVAAFLWSGATAAMGAARIRSKLPHLVGRELARRTLAVPDDLPLAEAVRRAQEAEAGGIVTVTSEGLPTGIVNEQALLATPEDRRPWLPVSSVSRALEEGLSLPATIYGEELVLAISRRPAAEYLLVEDDGSVFGILATDDVDRAFRSHKHA